jgi:hypothetical protein
MAAEFRWSQRTAWPLLASLAIGLGGCGFGSPAQTRSGASTSLAPDACSLYTLADAQRILGGSARKGPSDDVGSPSPQYRVSTCSYTSTSGQGATGFVSTTVLVRRAADPGRGKQDFLSVRQQTQGVLDVGRLGESAYWNPRTGQLHVWKGTDWIIISAGRTSPRNMDIARQVAAAVLQRD